MAEKRAARAWHDNDLLMTGIVLIANLAVVLHALDPTTGPVLLRAVAGVGAIVSAGIWSAVAFAATGRIALNRPLWRGRGHLTLGFAAILMAGMYAAKIAGA